MASISTHRKLIFFSKILLLTVSLTLGIIWLWYTPSGLLGKSDAIAYAVCHRIGDRSFSVGDRQAPLCARCSGMYLGALISMIYLFRPWRKGDHPGGLPDIKTSIVFGLFLVAFGIDGVNSYIHFFPSLPSAYQSQNWLRLVTGTGLGLGLGAVVVAVFNQSFWSNYTPRAVIRRWRDLGCLVGIGGLVIGAVLSENPFFLYPLAVFSSWTVLLILSTVYSLVWILLFKRENVYDSLKDGWVPLVAGFTTALLQIAVIDAGRFFLTGSWGGFVF